MQKSGYLLLLFTFFAIQSFSQERLRPAQRYTEGEVIFAPLFGMKSKVPKGWTGVLPRDTEVFLLLPNSSDGEIYVMGDSINYEIMKQRWVKGLDLGNGNTLLSDGNIIERGGAIGSVAILKNKTIDYKAYIEAKCSEYDRCVGALLITSAKHYEEQKKSLQAFIDNITFEKPSSASIYASFDWKEYLSNKRLMNYTPAGGSKSENEIRLCEDGSFMMKLKRTGELKHDAEEYKGRTNGTWDTSAIGSNGKLTLHFDKLPDLELNLHIDDDQVFINDKRYFLMYGSTCK